MVETAGNVASVVSAIIEVGKCFGRPFMYLYSYKTNFSKLEKEVGRLKDARDEVKVKVDAADNNVEKIKQSVEDWQKEADSIIDEAGELIGEKGNNKCFNLITCYKNSRKASKKAKALTELLQEKETMGEVSFPVSTYENIRLTNKDYEEFGSRMSTLSDVLKALDDAEAEIIGVYGMGGIGKTTLVKEVGKQAKEQHLFDEVVFTEVSENPDTNKIQDELANQLGLKFETEAERASKLYARLKKDKKILVILDNIWKNLSLETVGIPSGADRGGCKLLMTARDLNVLSRMDSKSNFSLGILNEEEAWSLFRKMAGDFVDQKSKLDSLPNNVCKECGGLPIVITTIARALRNKRRCEWEDALRELRTPSTSKFTGLLEDEYSKIALSYYYLKGDELKKIFLIASLMVNNSSILDLLKYVMGLEILEGVNLTTEQARNRVDKLIGELKDSCLLLDGSTNEQFSMHDIVRVVALTVACRDQHVFTERNDVGKEWTNKDELRKCTKISLASCKVISEHWPEGLDCPVLEYFYMNMTGSSFIIPENFFTGLPKLKVLNLFKLSLLPSSLSLLTNLQTLSLDESKIQDLAVIGELKRLKVLSLRYSTIKQLPEEIGKLTQLRLLDLSNCFQLKIIASNVVSSLTRLEELYMSGCDVLWQVEGLSVERRIASLDELKHLPHLTTLEIDIGDDQILPKGLFSTNLERSLPKLQRIKVEGCQNMKEIFAVERENNVNNNEEIDHGMKFGQLRFLTLRSLKSLASFYSGLNTPPTLQTRQKELTINLQSNDTLMPLFSEKVIFPNLEALELGYLNSKMIWDNKLATMSSCYQSLTRLVINTLGKLKYVFPSSIVKNFEQLQHFEIRNCKELKEIIAKEEGAEATATFMFPHIESLNLRNLPELITIYSGIHTSTWPVLKKLVVSNCQKLHIFTAEYKIIVSPNLEVLDLHGTHTEKIWDSLIQNMSSCFQNLTRLIMAECAKLKYVFPSSMIRNFEQLQHLEISSCKELKEIVTKEEGAEAIVTFTFPQVAFLRLHDLPELTTFYSGIHTSEWPKLKELQVYKCGKLQLTSSFKFNPVWEKLLLRADNMMTWQSLFPENFFFKGTIEIRYDKSTNILLNILQRPIHIEKLILRVSLYKEIFSCGEKDKHTGTLMQINSLKLTDLSKLKYFWKQDSKLDIVLQNLGVLEVCDCHRLISLLPSHASFANLTVLRVDSCWGLINLFVPSTAKNLVQLMKMKIKDCKMITEIISNEDHGDLRVEDEIVFSKLKLLSLEDLENLTCFCFGNYNFEFPVLEELIVTKCPNMKIFSEAVVSTPNLRKVKFEQDDNEEECWMGDINTTIQHLHKKAVNSNLEELTLSGKDMTHIWQDQLPEHQFCQVKVLKVIKGELESIPIEVLQRFNNLEKLILGPSSYKEMFSCGKDEKHARTPTQIKRLELWGLSNLKYMWKQGSYLDSILQNLEVLDVNFCHNLIYVLPSSTTFENLTTLNVWCCDGLINLVSSSTAKSFVRLEKMTISECEMIREVVSTERDIENDEIVFEKLKSLSLDDLESLTNFCSGNYTFKFPSLEEVYILECWKMNTFSRGVLSTPKLEQIRYDRKNCWEGDLNTTLQHLHWKANIQCSEEDSGQTSMKSPE